MKAIHWKPWLMMWISNPSFQTSHSGLTNVSAYSNCVYANWYSVHLFTAYHDQFILRSLISQLQMDFMFHLIPFFPFCLPTRRTFH